MLCKVCHNRIDPVWVESGYDTHFACTSVDHCDHGEPRGARYCALCRQARPNVTHPGLLSV